jgi:hypothetical protein
MDHSRDQGRGSLRVLQVVLWFVGLSHLVLGACIMLSPALQQKAAALYGAQVDWTPQFIYILRPLGAFMLVLGIAGVVAALDPLRYRAIVYCLAALLLLRVLQRVLFRDEIADMFAIEPARNLVNAGFFLALALALIVLAAIAGRRPQPGAA